MGDFQHIAISRAIAKYFPGCIVSVSPVADACDLFFPPSSLVWCNIVTKCVILLHARMAPLNNYFEFVSDRLHDPRSVVYACEHCACACV